MITQGEKKMPKLPPPAEGNPVLPSGTYRVRLTSHEYVKASTGTPQIRWKAEVIDPDEHTGRTFVDHTALTEKAIWRVSNLIGATGLKFTPGIDTDSVYFKDLCHAAIGRTTMWVNAVEKDQKGNDRNNIKMYASDKDQEEEEFVQQDEAKPVWAD